MDNESVDKTTYVAFGDASSGAAGTLYGLLLIPEAELEHALAILSRVKAKYGGADDSRLHCRELYSGQSRAKSAWSHLDQDSVTAMCSELFHAINACEPRFMLGFMPVDRYPLQFRLRGKNGHADITHPIDNKWRELWVYQRVALLLEPLEIEAPSDPVEVPSPKNKPWWRMQGQVVEPGAKVSKVFLDRERTKVRWFSKQFQWTEIAKDLVVISSLGPSFLPVQLAEDDAKHPMLDLADIFVWNIARSLTDQPVPLNFPANVETVMVVTQEQEIVIGG